MYFLQFFAIKYANCKTIKSQFESLKMKKKLKLEFYS